MKWKEKEERSRTGMDGKKKANKEERRNFQSLIILQICTKQ